MRTTSIGNGEEESRRCYVSLHLGGNKKYRFCGEED